MNTTEKLQISYAITLFILVFVRLAFGWLEWTNSTKGMIILTTILFSTLFMIYAYAWITGELYNPTV